MRDDKTEIDSAAGLVSFCKSVNSPIKMNRRCAEIILDNYKSRDILLYTDKEGRLYQENFEGQTLRTTLDDVIDEACEWNYEDIEAARQSLKRADDYITKCRFNSQIEALEKEARALNYIFYQTKYGRNVEKLADRIADEVMKELNLVPIYDVPFYEDKTAAKVPEPDEQKKENDMSIHREQSGKGGTFPDGNEGEVITPDSADVCGNEISESRIVTTEFVPGAEMEIDYTHEVEIKGAR